jgi:hypothetical protein
MDADLAERYNLIEYHPEIFEELKALLVKYIRDGRSTPGAPQQNSGPVHDYWDEIDWIKQ